MATYFAGSSNNRDDIRTIYARDPAYASYPEAPGLLDNMIYLNHSSSAASYSNTLAGNSQLQPNSVDHPSVGALDSNSSQQRNLSDVFGSHTEDQVYSAWRDGRNEISSSAGPNQIHSNPSQFGITAPTSTTPSSKYLKAVQELLDEVVNVQKAMKQRELDKHKSFQRFGLNISKETERGSKNNGALPPTTGTSDPQESSTNPVSELSPAERQDLQNKMSKLLSMVDEVDRRYKQYYHQMQIVVSSFDMIAGCGSSKRYTALALQVISKHFRCLRDAISGQIKVTHRSLGEQDTGENGSGVGISRLRFVDQQLRQQRTLQQLGMMQQHAWRPQRGLPESAVSILRAWLFEHFLHPYPKDSDKTMLARQAGLTRSQVSNWFINARVRLWKPMVEEMYKEEICDVEMESNSSSDNATKAARNELRVSEDRGEVLLQNTKPAATERCQPGQFHESKFNLAPDVSMSGSTARANFQNGDHGEDDTDYLGKKYKGDQTPNAYECNLLKDIIIQSDGSGGGRFMATSTGYQITEFERLGSGGGVSLTLGLQHCDGGVLPISDRTHHNFTTMRGDKMYDPEVSSMGLNMTDYDCEDTRYRQHRFGSSHLLHDFVP
ncbi:Homeobox domain [Macleaya cordata]|uniref:Homeobox domain n=1 Tax=Macleaya cordata TaxID=56857 RepID=A0A200Q6U2_MACCD|nr:Homeobox domain [Macleaya cordata]